MTSRFLRAVLNAACITISSASRCGTVATCQDEVLGDLADRVERAAGFLLGAGELSLFGLCSACRAFED